MATVVGVLFALAGLVLAVVAVVRKLVGWNEVDPGWTSLVVLMLVIGGVIVSMLGLLGEYVGRIYMSLNNAPQFIVRDRVNCDDCGHTRAAGESEGGR